MDEVKTLDIYSASPYPSGALSNFAEHHFMLDCIQCSSMEGFIQALTVPDLEKQKEICRLVGIKAKQYETPNWKGTKILYWAGKEYHRYSKEYQDLLDKAYNALYEQCPEFRKALADTTGMKLIHTIGQTNISHTLLTEAEFVSRLTNLRDIGLITSSEPQPLF